MTKAKRIIITLLSLIGLGLAIELCVVYYNANFVSNAAPSICEINDVIDCAGAAKTAYSQFFGIPLSLWGVCLYLFFLFMTFVDKLQNLKFLGFLKVFKNPQSYIFCIGLLSFIISMILAGISLFKINAVCIFCFMTYIIDLLIALTAKTKGQSIFSEIKTSISDFIDAVKVPNYLLAFGLILILGICTLSYTSFSYVLTPQLAKLKEFEHVFDEDAPADGYKLGAEDADVEINEYMDFNCGGCSIAQLYLHRVIAEFENVRIIQHQLPLDAECNPNIKAGGGHKHSCLKSRYALAAARQNKYWQLAQAMFDPDTEDEKDIISAARLLNMDIKKLKEDAASEDVKQELALMLKEAEEKGIDGTPSLFIGIKKQTGAGTYPELVKTIQEQGGILKLTDELEKSMQGSPRKLPE